MDQSPAEKYHEAVGRFRKLRLNKDEKDTKPLPKKDFPTCLPFSKRRVGSRP